MKKRYYNELLEVATLSGKIIMENGGETYRSEEIMNQICSVFGASRHESFASPTSIILSITDSEGQVYSIMVRIISHKTNLDKVNAVSQISYSLSAGNRLTLDEVKEKLLAVQSRKSHPALLMLFCAGLISAAFTVMVGIFSWDTLSSFLTGLLVYAAIVYIQRIPLINEFFVNLVGGMLASLIVFLLVWLGLGVEHEAIIVSGLMPLVPGLMLTNGIRDIITGELMAGISRCLGAFTIAMAIAFGAGLSYMIINLFIGSA